MNRLVKIVSSENPSLVSKFILGILWILSLIYSGLMKIRFYLYQTGIFRRHRLSCPVISIGNITVGGTGKTPFVKYLAQQFQKKGYRVAILSRGYKKPSNNSAQIITLVSDFDKVNATWETAGDEPYLLAKSLPGVAVLVGNNRVQSGDYAIRKLGANLILLDDGFSHLRLHRNLDIVLLDATNPFGYGYCLPRGLLREPKPSLNRSNIVVFTRTELGSTNPDIKKYLTNQPVFASKINPLGLKTILSNNLIESSALTPKKVIAVSGIANPDSFEKTLQTFSPQIARYFAYPDHYIYSSLEIEQVRQSAQEQKADWIVTTEKDAVKIKPLLQKSDTNWLFLEIELSLFSEKDFWDCVEQRLQPANNMV